MSAKVVDSADGQGRTLWEIMTGKNKKDMSPLETRYFNPLQARIGENCSKISFDPSSVLIPEVKGVNFSVEKIAVYETQFARETFRHTDYFLRGIKPDSSKPLFFRLRLIQDENATNELGCDFQLLQLFDEFGWNQDFYDNVLLDESKEISINWEDADDNPVDATFWRVDDVFDPYNSSVVLLKDVDGNGEVEEDELDHYETQYWDYSRNTVDPDSEVEETEYLWVEKDQDSGFTQLYLGWRILPLEVFVL